MSLREYFDGAKGVGVLATAAADGKVDVALYSRPHFLDEGEDQLAFIMADRLSHDNLQSNPQAAYLFMEEAEDFAGKRLFLTKIGEETDREKIDAVRRKVLPNECDLPEDEKRFLVHFRIDGVRPLVGTGS